jgi:hypothetical protein
VQCCSSEPAVKEHRLDGRMCGRAGGRAGGRGSLARALVCGRGWGLVVWRGDRSQYAGLGGGAGDWVAYLEPAVALSQDLGPCTTATSNSHVLWRR